MGVCLNIIEPNFQPIKQLRSKTHQNPIKNDRIIPDKVSPDIFVWRLNSFDKIIIENIKLFIFYNLRKTVKFYNSNNIESFNKFNQDVDSLVIKEWIHFLSLEIFSEKFWYFFIDPQIKRSILRRVLNACFAS